MPEMIQAAASADGAPLANFLLFWLALAAVSTNRSLARQFEEAYGVGLAEWRVLSVVAAKGVVSAGVVGSVAALDKVAVSRATANLVARGLVKQHPDPGDRRVHLLRLTRKGAKVEAGLTNMAESFDSQLRTALGRTEARHMVEKLARLRNAAESLGRPGQGGAAAD